MADVAQIADQIDEAASQRAAAAVATAESKIAEAERTTEAMALAAAHGAHAQALEAHKQEVAAWRASEQEARQKLEQQIMEHKEILEKTSLILDRLSSPKKEEPPAPEVTIVEPNPAPEPEKRKDGPSAASTNKKTRRFL